MIFMRNPFKNFTVWDAALIHVDEGISIKDVYKMTVWFWDKPRILWSCYKFFKKICSNSNK